jgi:Protein of unknown function (DUF429)
MPSRCCDRIESRAPTRCCIMTAAVSDSGQRFAELVTATGECAVLLIGLDAAAQLGNFGYAVGEYVDGCVRLARAGILATDARIESELAQPLRTATRALIAVDAPLGWPAGLASELAGHVAGQPCERHADVLFRRETDRVVRALTGRQPLEVAADRIARAAVTALRVIGELRRLVGAPIPLALSSDPLPPIAVAEVYPAATLRARGTVHRGYKKPGQRAARVLIAQALAQTVPGLARLVDGPADVFDAAVCLAAGVDVLEGRCRGPDDAELARKEGWIWVRG